MFNSIQDAYNQTVEFLEKQGSRSINDFDVCLYLAPNGNKCAVGAWIPDGHPAQNERCNARALVSRHPDLLAKDGPLFIDGVSEETTIRVWMGLQHLHDRSEVKSEINSRLFNFAGSYKLEPLSLTKWGD